MNLEFCLGEWRRVDRRTQCVTRSKITYLQCFENAELDLSGNFRGKMGGQGDLQVYFGEGDRVVCFLSIYS